MNSEPTPTIVSSDNARYGTEHKVELNGSLIGIVKPSKFGAFYAYKMVNGRAVGISDESIPGSLLEFESLNQAVQALV